MASDRQLADTPFPGDTGDASERLRERLRNAQDASRSSYLRALVELGTARLLVPVVAETTRAATGHGGLQVDKEADMAVVGLQTPDGRRCAVAFTGLDSLAAWHPHARPVPVTLDRVAAAALDDSSAALIVDPAGPAALVVELDLLEAFAAGRRLVELPDGGFGWLTSVPDHE